MFYIEEKTTELKTRLGVGGSVRINHVDLKFIDYRPETKTMTLSFVHREMSVYVEYEHVMGNRWSNNGYVSEIGVVVENDWVYKLPVKNRVTEIPTGKMFPMRENRADNLPHRFAIRLIGFVTGTTVFDGIFQYSSFASNPMSDAMMFVGTDGRLFVFDYNETWYEHKDGKMVASDLKCLVNLKHK